MHQLSEYQQNGNLFPLDWFFKLVLGQELIAEVMNKARMTENDIALVHRLNNFIELDPTSLLNKSPCETMYLKKPPLTSNLTILCCKKCAGKEVKLV